MKKYAEIEKSNQSKIENSCFYNTVKGMLKFIDVYPPSAMTNINDDKKLRKISIIADPVYKLQLSFGSTVNDIKSSIILACNEMVVPHFIDEMAMFAAKYKYLLEERDGLKSSQELNAYYKDLTLKQKDIKDCFVSELKRFSESFDIGIEIKQAVLMFDLLLDKHYINLTFKRSVEGSEKVGAKHISLIDELYVKSQRFVEALEDEATLAIAKKVKLLKSDLRDYFTDALSKAYIDSDKKMTIPKSDYLVQLNK